MICFRLTAEHHCVLLIRPLLSILVGQKGKLDGGNLPTRSLQHTYQGVGYIVPERLVLQFALSFPGTRIDAHIPVQAQVGIRHGTRIENQRSIFQPVDKSIPIYQLSVKTHQCKVAGKQSLYGGNILFKQSFEEALLAFGRTAGRGSLLSKGKGADEEKKAGGVTNFHNSFSGLEVNDSVKSRNLTVKCRIGRDYQNFLRLFLYSGGNLRSDSVF
jgi:hypothetical protein